MVIFYTSVILYHVISPSVPVVMPAPVHDVVDTITKMMFPGDSPSDDSPHDVSPGDLEVAFLRLLFTSSPALHHPPQPLSSQEREATLTIFKSDPSPIRQCLDGDHSLNNSITLLL